MAGYTTWPVSASAWIWQPAGTCRGGARTPPAAAAVSATPPVTLTHRARRARHAPAGSKNTTLPRMRVTYMTLSEENTWLQPVVVTRTSLPPGLAGAEVVRDLTGPRDEVHLWSTLHELNYGTCFMS